MSRRIVILLAAFAAVLCGVAAFGWLHVRSQQPVVSFTPEPARGEETIAAGNPVPAERPSGNGASSAVTAPEPGFTPTPGEVLEFSASVAKVNNVASVRLRTREKAELRGKDAWHFQAFAHTQNPLRMIFALDDQFDSYSAPGNYTSLQYEMHLDERGQKVNSIQQLSATAKEPAPPGASIARVLPGTRDPLGMLQYLRSVDWAKTSEVRSPVYEGRKLYDIRARKTGSAKVSVPAGEFATNTIEIHVFDNGVEAKDSHFTLYLGKDAARTPALLEAVLPFATSRVELLKRIE